MTIDTKPEVTTSSVSDHVCGISSVSSYTKYSHPEVDKDLIPGKLSQLNMEWKKVKGNMSGVLTKCCLRRIFLKQKQLVSILSCSMFMSSCPTPLPTVFWIPTKICV